MVLSVIKLSILWSIPTILLTWILLLLLIPVRRRRLANKGLRTTYLHEIGLFVASAYVTSLLSVTLNLHRFWIALYYGFSFPNLWRSGFMNLMPLGEILTTWDVWMLFGNVLLFLPWGCLMPLLWKQDRLLTIWGLGTACSAIIECIQFFIGRSLDLQDLLCNSLGVLLGWGLWRILFHAFPLLLLRFRCSKHGT